MKKMTIELLTAAAVAAMPISATALTFKKGEVLGSDGQTYEGASPDIRARLIAKAQDGGKSAGVTGGQLYVVVRDTITFVPIMDIAGKSEETVKEIIVEKVTDTVTEALTQEALADAGIDVDALADGAEDEASAEQIQAALAEIQSSDVAGIAAAQAATATKEAWEGISQEDLAEATAYAAEFAAQEAANVLAAQDISAQLDALVASGASAEQIAEFEANNPAPE